jgi:hypothetical protein
MSQLPDAATPLDIERSAVDAESSGRPGELHRVVVAGGGRPWLVAGWIVLTALVSLVAFLCSEETRDIDITAPTR